MLLEKGRYELDRPVLINPEHSNIKITSSSNDTTVTGAKLLKNLKWEPYNVTLNAWKARVVNATTTTATKLNMYGLRVNGRRAVRARYPNADPERTLSPEGWITSTTNWIKPTISPQTNPPTEYVVTDSRYTRKDSTGNELQYQIGIGGSCVDVEPQGGYWCSAHPSRMVVSLAVLHTHTLSLSLSLLK